MKTLTLSLLTAAFIAPLASAGLVTATFNNVAPGAVVNYTLVSPSGGGGTHAGRFNWTVNANTGASLGPTFTAFCIELTQNVGFNQQYIYTETALDQAPDPDQAPFSPMGLSKAAQIARIITVFNADLTDTPEIRAAAAQVAIWETVYETNLSMDASSGNGNFYLSIANATIAAKANSYLASQVFAAQTVGLYALTSNTAQDMLVPTPGALALLGMGGLVATRRRRR